MSTIREQIVAAFMLGLVDAGAEELELMPSSDPASFPALHFIDEGQGRETDYEPGANRYRMAFTIEGFVEGTGGAAAHAALNALYSKTLSSVVRTADASDLIEEIEEGSMRIAVAPLANMHRLAFSHDFTVTFVTLRGKPDAI